MNMQKSTLKIGNHTLDYDGIRHYLITHSFIGWLIATNLRKKYNIPSNNTSEKWLERLTTNHWDLFLKLFPNQEMRSGMLWIGQDAVEKKLMPEVGKLAKALKLNEKLLRIFVIYDNVPYKINGPKLTSYVSEFNPIIESGTYMRIDKKTTVEDVKTELAKVKKWQQNKLQTFPEFQEHESKSSIVKTRKKQIEEGDEFAIQDYLAIEKEIILLFREQKSKSNYMPDEDYGNELVKPALERVAGNSIDEDDDNKFDILLKTKIDKLKEKYYTITRRYALPTQRDKNLIFELMSL